jgi:hypothetical protein
MTTSRADAYSNVITGLGTDRDKSSGGGFQVRGQLGPTILSDVYEQDAIAARIIDRLPDDATREDITLTSVDAKVDFEAVLSNLDDLEALNKVGDAWRWARLYGGSLLFMNVNDGNKMDEPLDLAKASKLSSLQVIESQFVLPTKFNPGLGARAFRNPEFYDVVLPLGTGTNMRKIHRSRVIRFDGVRVPPTRMIQGNGWGPSVLDRVFTEVSQIGEVMGYSRNIIHDISLMVLQIEGFRDMLIGTDKDQQEARAILESLKYNADNLHMLALDSKDKYIEVARTVSGLTELIDKFVDALVRATEMPRTIILGEQPSGLGSTADAEIRSWYDSVASQQKRVLTPALNRLLEVIFAIRDDNISEWVIDYASLWQPSAKEQAETYNAWSQGDERYMLNGVLGEDQVEQLLVTRGFLPDGVQE